MFLTCEGFHYYLEENPQHCFSPLEDPLHCVVTVKDPSTVSTCGVSLSLFLPYRGSPPQFSPQDPLHCFHLKIPITVFYLLSIPVIVFSCRHRCFWQRWQICHRCRWHRWCTLTGEYRCEFSKKFKMTLMLFSGAWGKMNHEKKPKRKILWHCPFNGHIVIRTVQCDSCCLIMMSVQYNSCWSCSFFLHLCNECMAYLTSALLL
jgi:hypothetical protein